MLVHLYLSADVSECLTGRSQSTLRSHRLKIPGALIAGLLLTLTGLTTLAHSAETIGQEAGQQIVEAVEQSLLQRVREDHPDVPSEHISTSITVNDATANLALCPAPLLVDWRGSSLSSRLTPRVACQELGWQVYLPVGLTVKVPVVVTARSISRGQRLTPADLSLALTDLSTLRQGHYTRSSELTGYEVARNLTQGTVVTPFVAKPPVMIERGDRVIIVATGTGLSVQTEGEALRDGTQGQQIPVINLSSRQTIHAYVKSKGVVEIPGR
ncbi:flagellar basal body P-ring formation chaperone FlgA [Saccharospirillum impatiens]|uniref:flagellar basal body P-ring formation chaperone FlgA n=1 Tax=Saccharospirillum impatiens TaxID=169438 RepID=UPI0004906BF5|nr:flagellar basal body P-ring formation chaperone FlgA [Saccharospirillum impatiens]